MIARLLRRSRPTTNAAIYQTRQTGASKLRACKRHAGRNPYYHGGVLLTCCTKEASMAEIDDVVSALVRLTGKITTQKLQKLLYYCQAWHLVRFNAPLFADEIQAWREGPVIRTIYQKHRGKYFILSWPSGDAEKLDERQLGLIRWVVAKYGGLSAESLSRMAHAEVPWRLARGSLATSERSEEAIPPEVIKRFYARHQADPDVAVTLVAASSALEGVELSDEWQEELRQVAYGSRDGDDLIAEEIRRVKGE